MSIFLFIPSLTLCVVKLLIFGNLIAEKKLRYFFTFDSTYTNDYKHTQVCIYTHVYVCMCIYICVSWSCIMLSHIQLFAILWNVAHQAPLSMGFSR